MITEKENYIRFITGKDVAFAPTMNLMGMVGPSYLYKDRNPDMSGFDFYGVEYVVSPESNGGFIPVPGKFILDDVTKWHDVIKNPDISGLDWEEMAKKDMAHIDRENVPVCANFIPGFFQAFINFMGFTEGLCAIYEEPEEVKALTEYITDFYCEVAKKMVEYYKPDMMWLPDDVCTHKPKPKDVGDVLQEKLDEEVEKQQDTFTEMINRQIEEQINRMLWQSCYG